MSSAPLPVRVPGSRRRALPLVAIGIALIVVLVGALLVGGVVSPARLGLGSRPAVASVEPGAGAWKT